MQPISSLNACHVTVTVCRQGMGVTGGTPIGFDVGAKREGGTLPGLDLGVRGMRQGGQRKLLVPPNLVRYCSQAGIAWARGAACQILSGCSACVASCDRRTVVLVY